MSAYREWVDWRASITYRPTRAGFRAAWRKMSNGKTAPAAACLQFGGVVVRLCVRALWSDEAASDRELRAVCVELCERGTVFGWRPSRFGVRVGHVRVKLERAAGEKVREVVH